MSIIQYFITDITNSRSEIGHQVILLPYGGWVPHWQEKTREE